MNDFMNRNQWGEIYDIARYNGYAVHQLINEIHAAMPNASELDIYNATVKWSKDRSFTKGG